MIFISYDPNAPDDKSLPPAEVYQNVDTPEGATTREHSPWVKRILSNREERAQEERKDNTEETESDFTKEFYYNK
jgi:hypothetical protein